MGIPASGPNAEQISYWNEQSGPKWVALDERLDALIAPHGTRALERAAVRSGEHALDVGCGCGRTTLEIAERVGTGGSATGIDISTVMLEKAHERARESGAHNVRFENADAQTYAFEPGRFDLVFSRFGVMFFADPVAAFANLHAALAPSGRLAFVCWQALANNPWMQLPLAAAGRHLTLPDPPAPGAPGPFAFGDVERLRGLLADAGFARIEIEPYAGPLRMAATLDEAVDFLLAGVGPFGALLRDASAELRARVADAVRETLAPFENAGGVEVASAAWVATARARGV